MFETKVIVAPNSPIALAKPSTMPASTPGSASGSVTVANTRQGAAPRVSGVGAAVARLDRKPDRAHQKRKRHHAAGERSTGPAEREDDAEMIGQPAADQS